MVKGKNDKIKPQATVILKVGKNAKLTHMSVGFLISDNFVLIAQS